MSEESQGRRRSIDRGGLIYTAPASSSLVGYAVMHPSSVPPPSPIYAFEAEEITELRSSERARGGRADADGRCCRCHKNLSVPTDEMSLPPLPHAACFGLGTLGVILSLRPDRIRFRSLNSISNLGEGSTVAGRTDGRGRPTCDVAFFPSCVWLSEGNPRSAQTEFFVRHFIIISGDPLY